MNQDRIEGALQDAAGKVQQTFGMATGSAGTRANGVAREVSGKSQYLYGQAKEGLEDAAESARDLAESATDSAEHLYNRIRGDLQRGSSSLSTRVEQNPVSGLVLAALAGFLAGYLVNTARR